MKRTALKSKRWWPDWDQPRKALKRKEPGRRRNAKRARERYERDFGEWAEEVRRMRCIICGRAPLSEAAHVRSRGAGGQAERNLLPLCGPFGCHHELHQLGRKTFEAKHKVDLAEMARELWEERADA